MELGDRIKQIRLERGLTQKDLEEASGVCQQMISKLEVGKAHSTSDIIKLAHALDVSPSWMEGIADEPGQYEAKPKSSKKKKPTNEGDALNRKAVQATLEFLTKDPPQLFTRTSFRRQTDAFARCYELCTQAKNKRLGKNDLVALLKRRIKRA